MQAGFGDSVSMALFCDFENIALGVRDARFDKLGADHTALLSARQPFLDLSDDVGSMGTAHEG